MDFTRKNSATSTQCSSCGGATWGSASQAATDGMDYQLQGSSDAYSQQPQAQYPSADYWCPRSSAGAQEAPVSLQLERFQSSTSRYDNPSVWMGGGGYSGLDPSQQMLDIGGGSPGTSHVETHLEEINQRLPRSCQPGSSALTRRNR
ncbi:hypothetical protein RB593_001106 [Gaeumannomyces tritici]